MRILCINILTNVYNTYIILSMKSKELLSLLQKKGWKVDRVRGSHHRLEKDGFEPITLPLHNGDLGKGLELAILKQAGLK